MNPSMLIARLLGPMLMSTAAAVLLNRKGFQEVIAGVARNPAVVYLSGVMMSLSGLAVLQFNSAWTASWEGVITLLGWLSLGGGVARMVVPDRVGAMAERMVGNRSMLAGGSFVTAALGTFLTIKGYFMPG